MKYLQTDWYCFTQWRSCLKDHPAFLYILSPLSILFFLSPSLLPLVGFLIIVTQLSAKHQVLLYRTDRCRPMSDGVIRNKCAKHDWWEKCHPRRWKMFKCWGWRGEVRSHSSQLLTDGPSSHFPSFCTMSLSSLMLYILHRLIYSLHEADAYQLLRKQCEQLKRLSQL